MSCHRIKMFMMCFCKLY